MRPSVSVLILTLNEERNIGQCIDSLSGFADIVVFDSFSTDQTCEIAKQRGARVIQRKFDNWAAHQNWAMDNIEFSHPGVLSRDADARITDRLRDELAALAAGPERPEVAYYCGRRNYFMGKWIRHAMPPGMIMRFFKPSRIRFDRLVNPVPIIDGPHGQLKEMFDHYNFSKGLSEWIDKHNKYSQFEAMEGLKVLRDSKAGLSDLFTRDPLRRRRALKDLSFSMPLRPALKFLWMYVLKGGFLDGRAGLTYCKLQAMYEYMIVIKMRELARTEKGLPT